MTLTLLNLKWLFTATWQDLIHLKASRAAVHTRLKYDLDLTILNYDDSLLNCDMTFKRFKAPRTIVYTFQRYNLDLTLPWYDVSLLNLDMTLKKSKALGAAVYTLLRFDLDLTLIHFQILDSSTLREVWPWPNLSIIC